jgi:uncharacterized membrane protein YvbJ
MTYCHRCGAQIEENDRFCHKCGAPVEAAPQPVIYAAAPPPPPPQPKSTVGIEPLIILALALLAILVAAIVIFVFYFSGFEFIFTPATPGNSDFSHVSAATTTLITAWS